MPRKHADSDSESEYQSESEVEEISVAVSRSGRRINRPQTFVRKYSTYISD